MKPAALPAAPPPAIETTVRFAKMRRILLFPVSATSTVPAALTATPRGPLSLAALPTPSMKPLMIKPANAKTAALVALVCT
jgi:hypothetical protein